MFRGTLLKTYLLAKKKIEVVDSLRLKFLKNFNSKWIYFKNIITTDLHSHKILNSWRSNPSKWSSVFVTISDFIMVV